MNYRHIYHAGNFADVFKHLALIETIEYYKKKESPFFVLDAFAGIGKYDISDERAEKHLEQNIYPGSPIIIEELLRKQDRMTCCELHPEDYLLLKEAIRPFPAHNTNAYHAIKAFTPPVERRGVIFLDPPFEETNEFEKLISAIAELHKRFRNGTVIIWLPIKNEKDVKDFYLKAKAAHSGEQIISALQLDSSDKLFKTSLLIINPTWGIESFMQKISKNLKRLLA